MGQVPSISLRLKLNCCVSGSIDEVDAVDEIIRSTSETGIELPGGGAI
jgi:hypothetical protein